MAVDSTPVKRLAASLDAAAADLGDLTEVDDTAARLILDAALSRVPRRTGSLASGHTVIAGHIRNTRYYAVPVHAGYRNGPRKVAGRPWITEGETAVHDQAVDLYVDRVKQVTGKVKT